MDALRRLGNQNAARVAALAKEAGHDVSIHHWLLPAGHRDAGDRYWCECTCGYKSTRRAAKVSAVGAAINHMAKTAADEDLRRKSAGQKSSVPSNVRLVR